MGKQLLGDDGQPVLSANSLCPHGVFCDDRGNNACEECGDAWRTSQLKLGIAVGWEEVEEWAKERSGREYAEGNDERAAFFRELAKWSKVTAKDRRKEFERFDLENPKGLAKKAS